MNDITYRMADINDLNQLVDLRINFLKELIGEPNTSAIEPLKNGLKEYFTDAFKNKSYISFLAKDSETVVGSGGMVIRRQPGGFSNPSGKVGYILNMFTIPTYRKRGICTRILELLIEEGEKNGIRSFELHATKEGEPLYQKNGFKIHKEPTYRKQF